MRSTTDGGVALAAFAVIAFGVVAPYALGGVGTLVALTRAASEHAAR